MKKRPLVFALMLLTLAAGCGPGSGDRVLVAKFYYDSGIANPDRYDVVVFRYPERPIKDGVPTNYIKRLLGLAGETIAIFFGQLFVFDGLTYPPGDTAEKDQWRRMLRDEPDALAAFRAGKFRVLRKPPATMLALRRIVYDHDHPALDLEGVLPPRWAGAGNAAWTPDDDHGFAHPGGNGEPDWLRYRHVLRPADWPERGPEKGAGGAPGDAQDWVPDVRRKIEEIKNRKHQPQLITDFSAYNSYQVPGMPRAPHPNWVGDLMLDCELTVDQPAGEFRMELSRGVDRFQARWDLADGQCTLVRLSDAGGEKEKVLATKETAVSKPGSYRLRFANFDDRLTVWVGSALPFGDGVDYESPIRYDADRGEFANTGPTANDLEPASLAAKGAAVKVRHLQLWRDTYYTLPGKAEESDALLPAEAYDTTADFWSNPGKWGPIRDLNVSTLYVQPGHYLCLGDNSPESSDSRTWGLVPQRLLLGRAVMVYYPFTRVGLIH